MSQGYLRIFFRSEQAQSQGERKNSWKSVKGQRHGEPLRVTVFYRVTLCLALASCLQRVQIREWRGWTLSLWKVLCLHTISTWPPWESAQMTNWMCEKNESAWLCCCKRCAKVPIESPKKVQVSTYVGAIIGKGGQELSIRVQILMLPAWMAIVCESQSILESGCERLVSNSGVQAIPCCGSRAAWTFSHLAIESAFAWLWRLNWIHPARMVISKEVEEALRWEVVCFYSQSFCSQGFQKLSIAGSTESVKKAKAVWQLHISIDWVQILQNRSWHRAEFG